MSESRFKQLEQGLRDLAQEQRATQQTAPAVEAALLAAFRAQQGAPVPATVRAMPVRPAKRPLWLWASGLAAALALLAGLSALRQPAAKPEKPEPVAKVVAPPAAVPARQQAPVVKVKQRMVRARAVRRVPRPAPQPVEIATGFFAVPGSEQLPPVEQGMMYRVQMPRRVMRDFGLPVPEARLAGTVNADVVVGQDGMARAVRFVNRPRWQ